MRGRWPILYRTKPVCKFLSERVALRIYNSMILPHFDYGDVIYNNAANQDHLEKLQRLQNRCLKICLNLNIRFGTDELHNISKMPKLKKRREAHVNNFMYNRLKNVALVDNRNIRTRAHDAPLFKVSIPTNEAYKRSLQYVVLSNGIIWTKICAILITSNHSNYYKNERWM